MSEYQTNNANHPYLQKDKFQPPEFSFNWGNGWTAGSREFLEPTVNKSPDTQVRMPSRQVQITLDIVPWSLISHHKILYT